MNYTLSEILNLAFRWLHIFAGILWIGATWYFTWLDRRFHTTDPDEVWMVHSGGFYQVRKVSSPSPQHTLHWFKWEAAYTWLTGIVLLILVYYMGGLMSDGEPGKLTNHQAILAGVGLLVVGWFFYDLILARNNWLALIGGFATIVALAYVLPRFMSPRAGFFHIGALLGTCMAWNVWARIIPGQTQMVRVAREGGTPDPVLATTAKNRSRHNTYMIMPVLAIMISNHFPVTTYGYQYPWISLAVITLVGWGIAHIVRNQ
jgi:uncharacterized membrane protein